MSLLNAELDNIVRDFGLGKPRARKEKEDGRSGLDMLPEDVVRARKESED